MTDKTRITIEAKVKAPIEKVWECFTKPEHIINWNFASDDWCCPTAVNDLKAGGKFSWRMESKDGKMGFDFSGVYDEVKKFERIKYTLDDEREVEITFNSENNFTIITETFEAENVFSIEQQRQGWQAIVNNFKKYVVKT
ncbi:MAG: SRPBCC family protein [Ignavibacteriales bacterium]